MFKSLHRRGWYDGWFYARFIDSDKSSLRHRLHKQIEDNKTILDIGCGTGGFALQLAKRSNYVTGVDVSAKQIHVAQRRKEKAGTENVEFILSDARDLNGIQRQHFDYTVFSFIIHEIPHDERLAILNTIRPMTKQVVILEYQIPRPSTIWGLGANMIEYFAGREHYRNFKDFEQRGGLKTLLRQTGFVIDAEEMNRNGIFQIVAASPNSQ